MPHHVGEVRLHDAAKLASTELSGQNAKTPCGMLEAMNFYRALAPVEDGVAVPSLHQPIVKNVMGILSEAASAYDDLFMHRIAWLVFGVATLKADSHERGSVLFIMLGGESEDYKDGNSCDVFACYYPLCEPSSIVSRSISVIPKIVDLIA